MSSSTFIARFAGMVIALEIFSFASKAQAADDMLAFGHDGARQMNQIYSVDSQTGVKTLRAEFPYPLFAVDSGLSYVDEITGKLMLGNGGGRFYSFDPVTNELETLVQVSKTDIGVQNMWMAPALAGGFESVISSGTDADGDPATAVGTSTLIGSDGKTLLSQGSDGTTQVGDGSSTITVTDTGISKGDANLIGKTDDGAIHIGENSLVTVERDGQQLLYATDGAGNVIPINVANGSDLLVNGVNVGTSLATNTADILSNTYDIADNKADIATNTTNIATNTTNIATNTTNIATNYGLIGLNTTNIETNQVAILTNAAAIGLHTMQIAGNAADIAINRHDIATNSSGVASAMAMAQLSEVGPGEKLVLSIGGGNWEGSTALAAGLSGRISQKLSVRGSASLASGNAAVSAGIGWRLK